MNECDLILQFKSPYIVKIVKIFNSSIYNFVLMEKADLVFYNYFNNLINYKAIKRFEFIY